MTTYRVRVRQELLYEVEAASEDDAWELVDQDWFGEPSEAVGHETPDIIWLRPNQ